MLKKFLLHPLLWIFLLALVLRFCQLSTLPAGFHVDEVKIGWNAYSLWLTGRDDWWHAFPLHYDTFGDQRPTGIFYASVPALAVFGLTQFAVRFTPALFGSLAVIGLFFFVLALIGRRRIALLSALLLAVSPWHITLSRASSEGIIAVTLVIFGLTYLIRLLNSPRLSDFLLSLTLLSTAFFFYHTSRLLVPVFVFILICSRFFSVKKIRPLLPALLIFIFTSLLTLGFALSPVARGRLSQVSVFTDQDIKVELDRLPFEEGQNRVLLARTLHNKVVLYAARFVTEYSSYFGGKFFLAPWEAKPARYQTVDRGLLLYIEFVLVALGLIYAAKHLRLRSPFLPLLLLLLVSPLPAAVTVEDAPNLHRALFMSPFLSVLAGLGLYFAARLKKSLLPAVLLLLCVDLFHYAHMYTVHNPVRDSLTLQRNVGAAELITALSALSGQYQKIYLTNRPDNLYPWYAFLTRQDPRNFNPPLAADKSRDWTFGRLVFSQYRCPSNFIADQNLKQVLAVDAEGCPVPTKTQVIQSITRTGGGHPYSLLILKSPSSK